MQKLSLKSRVMLCESYRFDHKETKKICLQFYNFSMIFYDVTKIQPFTLDLEETVLQTGPQDENLDCNWVPSAMVGGGSSILARGRLGSAEKGRRRHE
jgi:hypothetical protein